MSLLWQKPDCHRHACRAKWALPCPPPTSTTHPPTVARCSPPNHPSHDQYISYFSQIHLSWRKIKNLDINPLIIIRSVSNKLLSQWVDICMHQMWNGASRYKILVSVIVSSSPYRHFTAFSSSRFAMSDEWVKYQFLLSSLAFSCIMLATLP